MLVDHIYLLFVPHQFCQLTFEYALHDLAENIECDYTVTYYQKDNDRSLDYVPTTNDNILVFFYLDTQRKSAHFKKLKKRCPNATIVLIGGDMIYHLDEFHKNYGVDYYIDANDIVIKELSEKKCHVGKLYFTLSRRFGEFCESFAQTYRCEKNLDFVCLSKAGTDWRRGFFGGIKNIFSIEYDLSLYDETEIVKLYKRSKFTLGTTSPCADEHNRCRSMKDFRDWIGPHCDSLLIYDDHEQIVKDFQDIVPTYHYGDIKSLEELYNMFSENRFLYGEYLQRQKEWIKNNYVDQQLKRVLQLEHKYDLSI